MLFTHAPPPPSAAASPLDDDEDDGDRDDDAGGGGGGRRGGGSAGGNGAGFSGGRKIGLEADRLLCLTLHDPVEYLPPDGRMFRRMRRHAVLRRCLAFAALVALLGAVCAALWQVPSYKMPRAESFFRFEEDLKRERLREMMRAEGLLEEAHEEHETRGKGTNGTGHREESEL